MEDYFFEFEIIYLWLLFIRIKLSIYYFYYKNLYKFLKYVLYKRKNFIISLYINEIEIEFD